MEFESVWSGSLERQGACPSLSGYMGRSTLFIAETRAPKETAPVMLASNEGGLAAMRKYRQTAKAKQADRERQRRRAKVSADLRVALKLKDQRQAYHAAYYQQRKAAQQSLFADQ